MFSAECEEALSMLLWGVDDPRKWWSMPRDLRAYMVAVTRAKSIITYYDTGGE